MIEQNIVILDRATYDRMQREIKAIKEGKAIILHHAYGKTDLEILTQNQAVLKVVALNDSIAEEMESFSANYLKVSRENNKLEKLNKYIFTKRHELVKEKVKEQVRHLSLFKFLKLKWRKEIE